MSQSISFSIFNEIEQIEKIRNSRVLVLAASHLELEILPELYQQLLTIGHAERLDVILHARGGVVNAARRIALLLRQFTDHLSFIVPYYCESSATILTLCADEVIAGELAIFTPIDPHLHGGSPTQEAPSSMSCLDIKEFGEMCESWFGVNAQEAKEQSLSLLCNSIFPPTLTAFYRTTLELTKIGEELIRFQLPMATELSRTQIIKHLMFNYHSHNYAITREELKSLGLNIQTSPDIEPIAWLISLSIQQTVGGAVREHIDAPWIDTLLATRDHTTIRENSTNGLLPKWNTL